MSKFPRAGRTSPDPGSLPRIGRATLRRIAALMRPELRTVLAIGVLLVSSAILDLLQPVILKLLIDHAIPERHFGLFAWLCVGMIAAPLGADLLDVREKYLTTLVGERVVFNLRNALYRHLQRQPLAYFLSAKPGEALSSVLNDVQGVGSVVSDKVMEIAQNTVVSGVTMVILFALDWRLALVAIFFLPFFAVPSRKAGQVRKKIKRAAQEKLAQFVGMLSETLSISGVLLLRLFGTEETEAKRVEEKSREIMDLSLRQALIGRWLKLLLGFLANAGPAALWGVGGYLVLQGDMKLGTLVASAAAARKLYGPAGGLATLYADFVTSCAYFDRIFAVLDLAPAIADGPDAVPIGRVRGALSFQKVSFAYGPETEVLHDLDLEIAPGQAVAFVGPSGSGKSTLVALVGRLYDPTSGAITLDGVDLRRIQLKSLRAQIGVVSQETFLFNTTMRENLRYGRPGASDEEVVAAATAAELHDFVLSLPAGYDTLVGERGYALSGGERQRVAIARAILRDARILILDEATSALDSRNEALIQAALEPLMVGRTSLVIAHRLSTVRNTDLIVVLEHGRIVERGRHDDLLAANGLYAELHRQQIGTDSAGSGGREDAA
jgi:ATP-binding cassette, subfamily B, bacterial